ncbi:DNA polymerase-3 subunit gamma/tau [Sulfuritortus calidifontis]|uniref:DNA polymerase III subunit gamma/tau n=1 Tax=Sulfuritortus calidifontis TaxID=1914471 RepID=A0A4R3JWE3_9PROT|nr:DNA polymerase III subunit gamma/tau [Sulfuritortus calidifontis]TCS72435.1 DNA polymerase-3 subunit gamma/tau [Sulfuritortus calidifontis]
MSHQVLARKWRPKSFAELVGQEHVVRALSNALNQGRLHHAYLLTGTRGCGKTTIARILAKCLNCETGPTATPCGNCPACREIESGRFVDLIEIDAASYTGVDNMREVLENAQYAPTAGRYKVYIIDEVHMLSKSAFNAMLKTLEEPPAHVVFILATTDPQKVPVTVLSRCLQFNLKLLPPARVAEHLKHVLTAEGISNEPAALPLIARAAAGSMRDALSLLDQAIAYGGGSVREQETRDMLGSVDQAYLFPILEALAGNDGAALMREAENIAARSFSFEAALQDLGLLLHQIALAQTVPEAVAEDVPERERLFALARALDAETVQLYYQIAGLGRRDLEWAPDEYAGFSMALMRMLAFSPGAPAPAMTAPTPQAAPQPAPRAAPSPMASAAPAAAAPMPAASPTPAPASSAPASVQGFDGDWLSLAGSLNGLIGQLASACELIEHGPDRLRLRLPESQKSLLAGFGDKLKAALQEKLGPGLKVEFQFGATQGAAPAEVAARNKAERQAEAEAAIQSDPFVQAVVQELDGKVTQIQPLQ